MSTSAVELYEALTSAPDDKTRARLIAEAFERLDERYPHLKEVATQAHLRETELRLLKEIEQVRREIQQARADLRLEIEQLRSELKGDIEQLRAELKGDIERLRAELKGDIEQLRGEVRTQIAQAKVDLLKWVVPLMLAQVAAIAALVKLL
jgi:F0F1-type ATP synthase membrane subunit b/b'